MPQTLKHKLRTAVLAVLKSPLCGPLPEVEDLRTRLVEDEAELVGWFREVRPSAEGLAIVVAEDAFVPTIHLIREKLRGPGDKAFPVGVVVISRNPERMLAERDGFPELLDVWTEEEGRKPGALLILRAMRLLSRVGGMERPRADHNTLLKLNEIFIALSAERDPRSLLSTILTRAMQVTSAEGGMLYMVEEEDGELYFRIRLRKGPGGEVKIDPLTERVVEGSLCGYTALTGKPLNIADLGNLRPYSLPNYDAQIDYHLTEVKSILTMPLRNRQNETVALLQLVNKREEDEGPEMPPVPFEPQDESLLTSFGTQAAICLENLELYGDIRKLFDGFVKASITAIESRDPSTGGHSERVAKMSVALARATTECQTGIYRSVRFKEEEIVELNYAALLHDFGKIGVREEVLVKAKKLYPYQLEAIKERIRICKAAARIHYLEQQLKQGRKSGKLDEEYQRRLKELDNYWRIIVSANEPSILRTDARATLDIIRNEKLLLPDGNEVSVLTEDEYSALSVAQGTLSESERLEVESHVRHTYQFLKMIPWTKDFKHLTEIAYAHHEKLDGSGYPRNLTAHEIPLQSKIMTITDIYDALTAADRWYKEAVPTERAIEILGDEVSQGKLDPVLFELFVEKRIYLLSALSSTRRTA